MFLSTWKVLVFWKQVMQLDLCGRCMTLSTLLGTIARSSNCLPALSTMSLRGACRLLNEGIGVLVTSARRLQSLNLGQCSLLTHFSINVVAEVLGHTLKELFIDDCQNINAMLILPALKRLECLEVLSVAGIQTVCDDFISEIVTALGSNMKELVLANCLWVPLTCFGGWFINYRTFLSSASTSIYFYNELMIDGLHWLQQNNRWFIGSNRTHLFQSLCHWPFQLGSIDRLSTTLSHQWLSVNPNT